MPGGSESRLAFGMWMDSLLVVDEFCLVGATCYFVVGRVREREREIEGGENDDNSRTYHQTLLDVVRIPGDGSNGKLRRKRRRGFSFSFDWREKWRKIYDLAVSQVIMRKPEDGEKKEQNSGWNFIRGGDLNALLGSCCSYSSHLLGTVHFLIPIVQIAHARAWDHSIFVFGWNWYVIPFKSIGLNDLDSQWKGVWSSRTKDRLFVLWLWRDYQFLGPRLAR